MKRGLSLDQVEAVMAALSITPCAAVFTTDYKDTEIFTDLAEQIVIAENYATAISKAREWANEYGRPMLVIGESELLDAVYDDGHKEPCLKDA